MLFDVDLTDFCTLMKGHIEQDLWHLNIPLFTLLGLDGGGGTLALMSLSLMLWGLLKAIRGGLGKIFAIFPAKRSISDFKTFFSCSNSAILVLSSDFSSVDPAFSVLAASQAALAPSRRDLFRLSN